jgi:pimeloyl-ACP methyl ester carboxylesterase
MPISRANGLDIYYEKAGSGPPLVLLHAMPFDHNLWLFQVADLSSRFTTIALDIRGWGRSAKPTSPFSLRDMADDVMGVLADEGLKEKAIVLGCSFGSKISLLLGLDHPEIFAAVIVVGGQSGLQPHLEPHIGIYSEHAAEGRLEVYHRQHLRRGVTEAWADTPLGSHLIEGFVERGRGLDAASIGRVFQATMNCDLTDRLAGMRVPLLIVNGEHDSAFGGGARTAELVEGAVRRVIPHVGHCSFLEDPGSFRELMEEFLQSKKLWPPIASAEGAR